MKKTIISVTLSLSLLPFSYAQECDQCDTAVAQKADDTKNETTPLYYSLTADLPIKTNNLLKSYLLESYVLRQYLAGKPLPIAANQIKTPAEAMDAVVEKVVEVPEEPEKVVSQPINDLEEAAANFKERYPKTKVLNFSLTPVKGLYEADVAREVIYFDKSARFIFTGRLLDLEKGIDLTDSKLKELRRIDIHQLPLDMAIKQVKGNGQRELVVFTDVDCPFSRKLYETLDGLDNVTIWTFLFPLASIHPEARAKSISVWCNKDSLTALDYTMKGNVISTLEVSPLCVSPVDQIIKLGAELGIGGTPTIINKAGDRIAGAVPIDKLEAFIDAGYAKDDK